MNRNKFLLLIFTIALGCVYFLVSSFGSPEESYKYNRDRLEIHVRDGKLQTVNIPAARGQKYLMYIDEVMKGPLQQNDPRILDFIQRKNYIQPPSALQYNLTSEKDPSAGQSGVIKKILGNMRNGFFIECGGLDGETRSNTLDLEKNFGWRGLLIEGDPKNYEILRSKNRKAWTSNSCLATKPYPHEVEFEQNFNIGKIKDGSRSGGYRAKNVVHVQCFPLFSLLSVLNVKMVDYFSLDVEGSELQVLKTIPFDSVQIKVISVEYVHGKKGEGKAEIKNFMLEKGYKLVTTVQNKYGFANDFIFMHSSVNFTQIIPPVNT